jgi:hypothetical protein
MTKYDRSNLVHGIIFFVDSFVLWLGAVLISVKVSEKLSAFDSLLIRLVGAVLFIVGAILTVIEWRAFVNQEYDERGFPVVLGEPAPRGCRNPYWRPATRDPQRQFTIRTFLILIWFLSLAMSWWRCVTYCNDVLKRGRDDGVRFIDARLVLHSRSVPRAHSLEVHVAGLTGENVNNRQLAIQLLKLTSDNGMEEHFEPVYTTKMALTEKRYGNPYGVTVPYWIKEPGTYIVQTGFLNPDGTYDWRCRGDKTVVKHPTVPWSPSIDLNSGMFKDMPYRTWELSAQLEIKPKLVRIEFKYLTDDDGNDIGVVAKLIEAEKKRIQANHPSKDYVAQLMDDIEWVILETERSPSKAFVEAASHRNTYTTFTVLPKNSPPLEDQKPAGWSVNLTPAGKGFVRASPRSLHLEDHESADYKYIEGVLRKWCDININSK